MALVEMLIGRIMMASARLGIWPLLAILILALLGNRHLKRSTSSPGPHTRWWMPAKALLAAAQVFAAVGLVMSLGPGKSVVAELRMLHDQTDSALPDITFRKVTDNMEHSLRALRGHVVLLNVWGTWCPPCRAEMPALEAVQARFRDHGLVVAALSDEDRGTLERFLAENPSELLHVYDATLPPFLASTLRPKTLLIDRLGRLRDFAIGAQDESFFASWVEPYLTPATGE